MPIGTIRLGSIEVSRLIIGGNPFSGVSHQNPETDLAMKRFFTVERIKQTLRSAEELGITAFIGRGDRPRRKSIGFPRGLTVSIDRELALIKVMLYGSRTENSPS